MLTVPGQRDTVGMFAQLRPSVAAVFISFDCQSRGATMLPSSVGRIPRGLLCFLFFALAFAHAQSGSPALLLPRGTNTESCPSSPAQGAAFPFVEIDCTAQLEYLGSYAPDGEYSAVSSYRWWYNHETSAPVTFSGAHGAIRRPLEVPSFVTLPPQERFIENLEPPARAVKAVAR